MAAQIHADCARRRQERRRLAEIEEQMKAITEEPDVLFYSMGLNSL
jgi:hypothetical protein